VLSYRGGRLDPVAITAYCIEEYLNSVSHSLRDVGIKSLIARIENGELEGFYKNTIKKYTPIFKYSSKLSDSDLENLSEEPPFSHIFKILKLS
jgi:hypothetical protein